MECYRTKLNKLLAKPDTLELIETHVSNGGSILDLCTEWDVRWSDVNKWLYEDEVRAKRYNIANSAQGEYTIQRILQELKRLSFIDTRQLYNDDDSLKPVSEWPEDVAHAIIGVDVQDAQYDKDGNEIKGRTVKVKLADKLKALAKLGDSKDLQLFTNKIEHTGKVTLLDLVAGSLQTPKDESKDTDEKPEPEPDTSEELKDDI